MKLKMIVAMTKKLGIGYKNTLPWRNGEDLKRFAGLTKGDGNNAIIMGRNTWNSLPFKPLKNRRNIVLSSTIDTLQSFDNTIVCKNVDEVILDCIDNSIDELWIIGGEQIYKSYIRHNSLEELYVTLMLDEYECDTFFPNIPVNFELNKMEVSEINNCYYCSYIRKF
jgi:dihydrofolate reductase